MRKKMMSLAMAAGLAMGIAQARPVFVTVLGTGVISDPDRQSAIDQAADTAYQSANNNCAGTVVRAVKAPPFCLGGGDNPYVCTVIVTATCQIGY